MALKVSGEKLKCKYDFLDLSLGSTADFDFLIYLNFDFLIYKTEKYNIKPPPPTLQGSTENQGRQYW